MKVCLLCGKKLIGRQKKFCCIDHSAIYRRQQNIENWLAGKDEGYSGTGIKDFIRKYLFEINNNKCQICGWSQENPYSGLIPLEVHHIDGNYKNNKIENLQLLCPNCHSLTKNYKSLNKDSLRDRAIYTNRKQLNNCIDCGAPISKNSLRCPECEAKRRMKKIEELPVTRDELKNLIRSVPFTQIGKQYHVSDNCIRKWCKKLSLPYLSSEIKKYSDEDWKNI